MSELTLDKKNDITRIFDRALELLDKTDLRVCDQEAVTQVDESLESVLMEGEFGEQLLEQELWRGLNLKNGVLALSIEDERDIDGIWLKKERLIEALAKTGTETAFKAMAPLLLANQADEIFNNRVMLTVERALVNIKGDGTKEALSELSGIEQDAIHPQTMMELEAAIAGYMHGSAPKVRLRERAAAELLCGFCGAALDEDADFCSHCGMPAESKAAQQRQHMGTRSADDPLKDMKISRDLYSKLYYWCLANFVVGVFLISLFSMWTLWKVVRAKTEKEAMKYVYIIIGANIVSNVLGIISIIYLWQNPIIF